MANIRWFAWSQNNSGGFYMEPGKNVLIEAHSKLEAIAIFDAEYYDDFYNCECCGDRWSHEPDYLGIPGFGLYTALAQVLNNTVLMPEYKVPVIFIRYYDGTTSSLSWSKGNG